MYLFVPRSGIQFQRFPSPNLCIMQYTNYIDKVKRNNNDGKML